MMPSFTPLTRRVAAGVLVAGIAGVMVGTTVWAVPGVDTSASAPSTDLQVALASMGSEPTQLGVVDDKIYRISDADLDATLDNLSALGVTDIRVGAPWQYLEADGENSAAWSRLDDIVEGAQARGMNVVIVAAVTSPWSAGETDTDAPRIDEFAAFAAELAKRYRGKVRGYEVWSSLGDPGTEPGTVMDLLVAATAAIQAADPTALVATQQTLAAQVASIESESAPASVATDPASPVPPTPIPSTPTESTTPPAPPAETTSEAPAAGGGAGETSSPTTSTTTDPSTSETRVSVTPNEQPAVPEVPEFDAQVIPSTSSEPSEPSESSESGPSDIPEAEPAE
ncbi:cellulase family glycosylhydrolase [Gordonia sp. VNK1]|uniref:cellulase family glycosylhydrolase n=1 Tax=Gordonia oleivorans TaxID=3156618 RepID=UPI0032B5F172